MGYYGQISPEYQFGSNNFNHIKNIKEIDCAFFSRKTSN